MNEAAISPVTDIGRAVTSGRARAVDMVEEALHRIERDNGAINAVIALRADEAIREAAALDLAIGSGTQVGPMAGVPVLIKDMEDVAGMRTTFGSLLFADAPPAVQDGAIPAALRAAGAIIVGKTNMPEFATEGYTDNLVFGATHNPWAPGWSPGGSSGGSAAAMAAGLVPFATATDGGGSIRIPAAFCGLVGIKPTLGSIPRYPPHDWLDLSTPGPFATTVADLRLLLAVESGIGIGGDPSAFPRAMDAGMTARPSRLVAAHRTSDLGPLPASVVDIFEQAVTAMSELLELDVTWLQPGQLFPEGDPDLDWFILATAEHVAALGRNRIFAAVDRMHPAARSFLEAGLAVEIDAYLAARRRRCHHTRRLDDLLGRSGLLLTPTVASDGWPADGRLTPDVAPTQLPPEVYSTAVQNLTGHPAISLPAGMSGNGVPFGLQVTGPRFSDAMLLDVADRWEGTHPWPLVAPGYRPFAGVR